MNPIQVETILLNLTRQTEEFIFAIIGEMPESDSGSFYARLTTLFDTFKSGKEAFSMSPYSLRQMAALLSEYATFSTPPIDTLYAPEILTPALEWESIDNKPATFPPDAHAHSYADVTDKPATFPPDAHAHSYADVTDKPATFAPDAHTHAYTDLTGASASLRFIQTTTWMGNGQTGRNITLTCTNPYVGIVIASNGLVGTLTSGGTLNRNSGAAITGAVTWGGSMTLNVVEMNASSVFYTVILIRSIV